MRYIIGLDQSTQGTKAVLFDESGNFVDRVDKTHIQIINEKGWVSHNLMEIYQNTIQTIREVIEKNGIQKSDVIAIGISNQRETTAIWNKQGKPLADAIVWQCKRAEAIANLYHEYEEMIYERTGIPLSPYFPASKMVWLLSHVQAQTKEVCIGTIDTWLVYKLTEGETYATDYSNASRTQLFNLHTLKWDTEICEIFDIPMDALPEVRDSNDCFGYTTVDGFFEKAVPIHAVLGDSHAALFGQGCHSAGMVKATYGTGSSIMMNVGDQFIRSQAGLTTSLAWSIDHKVEYVLEGNINYAGAVITWLQQDMHLIESTEEVECYIAKAKEEDTSVLIPAFTGLGAPYWKSNAKAMLYGMSRTTGQAEIVKAAVESIAFQVADVVHAMNKDGQDIIKEIRVDGGPTRNSYLMQFESDMTQERIQVSKQEELSAIGAAYMAGIGVGLYEKEEVFSNLNYEVYEPKMDEVIRQEKLKGWKVALDIILR